MVVFPIPPTPIRAIDVRDPASWTISSIGPSRPKKIPGGGGGSSPGTLRTNVRPGSLSSQDCRPVLNIRSDRRKSEICKNYTCHVPPRPGCQCSQEFSKRPDQFSTCPDPNLQHQCWCSRLLRPSNGVISDGETMREHAEHTLKTRRILSSFKFHPGIASLSLLEWMNRQNQWRPFRFSTFLWISATVLRSRSW